MQNGLDAHARPPQTIQDIYKQHQKQSFGSSNSSSHFDDESFEVIDQRDAKRLNAAFKAFSGNNEVDVLQADTPVYSSKIVPGLQVVPNAIPTSIQRTLLSRLLHRDLSNPQHVTNIHKLYQIPYPAHSTSFFTLPPSSTPIFTPKNPTVHKPLSITQFLTRKLRWLTLGGQYDWTAKVYPSEEPPPFPSDIAKLLQALFPDMQPEAAIVNFYSPGDTLSMHRDVAEFCDAGLISVSIGCDAFFVIGLDDHAEAPGSSVGSARVQVLRLRSGDVVYMSGPSRFAWHGVPQVIAGTSPEWLREWPAGEGEDGYEAWRGWMETKRVNLNVRQMWGR